MREWSDSCREKEKRRGKEGERVERGEVRKEKMQEGENERGKAKRKERESENERRRRESGREKEKWQQYDFFKNSIIYSEAVTNCRLKFLSG